MSVVYARECIGSVMEGLGRYRRLPLVWEKVDLEVTDMKKKREKKREKDENN